jgi:hypothetical protein
LETFTKDLTTALGLGAKDHVAIVGAGGKTSLMFALAEELRMQGPRVVTGTTTKVWYKEATRFACVIISRSDSAWHEKVREDLEKYGHVFVGASHEPVIPPSVTLVVAMMGLEAMGKTLAPEFVFRLERFKEITGLVNGAKINSKALGEIFHSPKGLFKGTPASARRVAFLNKLDLLADDQEAKDLANLLLSPPNALIDRVVIGSIKEKKYLLIGEKP